MCVLYLQHISVWASHISSAQEPLMAGGSHGGRDSPRGMLVINKPYFLIWKIGIVPPS